MLGERVWYTRAFNPAMYWVELSVILLLGTGHYLLSLIGPTAVAVGTFPLFLTTGYALGWAAHSKWLVGRMLLPVLVIAFFVGGLSFGEVGGYLYPPIAAVATIGVGVIGYHR